MSPSTVRNYFLRYNILCALTHVTRKLKVVCLGSTYPVTSVLLEMYGVYKRSAHQMNALLSEVILILVRAECELRSTSYDPKHALRWLPVRHLVRNYTHNSISKGGIRTFYLFNDCSTIGDIYYLG